MLTSVVPSYIYQNESITIGTILLTKLRFSSFSTDAPPLFLAPVPLQDTPWQLIITFLLSSLVCNSLSVFLCFFMFLKFLKSTSQVFCRGYLNLGSPIFLLMIRVGLWDFGKNTFRSEMPFSSYYIRGTWYQHGSPLVTLVLITCLR